MLVLLVYFSCLIFVKNMLRHFRIPNSLYYILLQLQLFSRERGCRESRIFSRLGSFRACQVSVVDEQFTH